MKPFVVLGAALAACSGPAVELGGQDHKGPVADAAPAATLDASPAVCGYPVHTAACTYGGSCDDGSGYLADTPSACQDATGSAMAFTSTSDVAAAVVGVWTSCSTSASTANSGFVPSLDANAGGIEFTTDGRFVVQTYASNLVEHSLVPASGAQDTGTFEVVDSSATLGPGTYELRLKASDGGVHVTQIVVFPATPKIRFFSPVVDDYAPAMRKKYRANVCGPPFGPTYTPSSPADALVHMQGRWARCPVMLGHLSPVTAQGQGIEFPGDGTWYTLTEDGRGNLVRSSNPLLYGTVQVESLSSSLGSLRFSTPGNGYEDLDAVLGECGTLTFAQQGDQSFEYVLLP